MIWYDINKTKPLAYKTGCWDGKKVMKYLVYPLSRKYIVAVMYHVMIDSSETFDFYDKNDVDIKNVQYWTNIYNLF